MLLSRQVREKAEATGSDLREQGSAAVDRLERLGETASGKIGHISEAAAARMEKLIDPVENAASMVAKKAAELFKQVQTIVTTDLPYIPIWIEPEIWGIQKTMHGGNLGRGPLNDVLSELWWKE